MNTERIDVLAVMDSDRGDAVMARAARYKAEHAIALERRSVEARAAVADAIDALRLAERTISDALTASGYKSGSCTDEWAPEIRAQVAALVPIRAALARVQGTQS